MRYRSTLLLMDAFPGAVFIDICKDPNGNQCCAAQGNQTLILYHKHVFGLFSWCKKNRKTTYQMTKQMICNSVLQLDLSPNF